MHQNGAWLRFVELQSALRQALLPVWMKPVKQLQGFHHMVLTLCFSREHKGPTLHLGKVWSGEKACAQRSTLFKQRTRTAKQTRQSGETSRSLNLLRLVSRLAPSRVTGTGAGKLTFEFIW